MLEPMNTDIATVDANFTSYQTANPASPLPGNAIDAEYNAIKVTTDALIASLSLIQRSDGRLANQSVGPQQLQPNLLAGINPQLRQYVQRHSAAIDRRRLDTPSRLLRHRRSRWVNHGCGAR